MRMPLCMDDTIEPTIFAVRMLRTTGCQLLTCMPFVGATGPSQTASSQLLCAT